LKSIRRKLRDLREKIIEKLEDLFTLSIYKNMIAEPIVTLRNGRYVVPIKKSIHLISHQLFRIPQVQEEHFLLNLNL